MNKSALLASILAVAGYTPPQSIYARTGRTNYTTTNRTRENSRRLRQMQRNGG